MAFLWLFATFLEYYLRKTFYFITFAVAFPFMVVLNGGYGAP